MSESAHFAVALSGIEGVGRVTAGRLLSEFKTYDALLRYPFEQVQNRLPGIRGANRIVHALRDENAMRARLAAASVHVSRLSKRHIQVIAPPDTAWPARINALPYASRPFILYVYGAVTLVHHQACAVFGTEHVEPSVVERAQALTAVLASSGQTLVTGLVREFDVAMHVVPAASILMASSGFSRIRQEMRATISQVTRAGGALVGPFPLDHGPFNHDDRERAVLQAALAAVCVFFSPTEHSSEWDALDWVLATRRSAVVVGNVNRHLAPNVRVLPHNISANDLATAVMAECATN